MGKIGRVFNNRTLYPENYSRREIWAEVVGTRIKPQICFGVVLVTELQTVRQ